MVFTQTMSKPPILFVHGASCDARVWQSGFMPPFVQAGFECRAIDLPGHGERRVDMATLQSLGLDDYLESIRAAIGHASPPPVLIGHSMGGYLLQRYVLSGGAASALVLLASVPPRGMGWEMLQFAFRHPLSAIQMDWGKAESLDERWRRAQSIMMTPHTPHDVVERVSGLLQAESMRVVKELGTEELPDRQLSIPVFVGIGGQDALIRPEAQMTTAYQYGVAPHLYPEMGHMLHLEPGFETVIEDILKFLAPFISVSA
jgi:pimeloyl-ACP methyl ester carboxylesterase